MARPKALISHLATVTLGLVVFAAFPHTSVARTATDIAAAERALRIGDYKLATRLLTAVAETGDAPSQYRLAALIRSGRGGAVIPKRVLDWMRRAAQGGHERATLEYAIMLRDGYGTRRDPAAARIALRRLASSGNADALRLLAGLDHESQQPQPTAAPHWTKRVPKKDRRNETAGSRDTASPGDTLIQAVQRGLGDAVGRLLSEGVAPNTRDDEGNTPLILAARIGQQEIVSRLLTKGANSNAQNNLGDTALLVASRNGHSQVVAQLLAAGANPNVANARREKAVDAALQGCHAEPTRQLFASKALVDNNQYYQVALHVAAKNCRGDIVRLLVDNARSIDEPDGAGRTPLWHASAAGNVPLIDLLLSREANPSSADRNGDTALHRATSAGHQDAAKVLIDAGAPINFTNRKGNSPLMLAANSGLESIVALLANRADLDLRNDIGMTALMLAAQKGHHRVVGKLLYAGAKVDLRNARREKAIDLARINSHKPVVSLLADK